MRGCTRRTVSGRQRPRSSRIAGVGNGMLGLDVLTKLPAPGWVANAPTANVHPDLLVGRGARSGAEWPLLRCRYFGRNPSQE